MVSENPHYFLAVPLPVHVKQQLHSWQDICKQDFLYKQWTHRQDYHITLQFLGGVSNEKLLVLKHELQTIEKIPTFSLCISGLHTFGKKSQPRVLWAGVQKSQRLQKLHQIVEDCTHAVGFPKENREYCPHITIGKKWQGQAADIPVQQRLQVFRQQQIQAIANQVVLYRIAPNQTPKYREDEIYSLLGKMYDMAQLIKLRDYISRYEWDMYRYPSQFIRLKQDNWQKLLSLWEDENDSRYISEEAEPEKDMFFTKLKSLFKRNKNQQIFETENETSDMLPANKKELKYYFLDKLFSSQLKWATSTVSEVSFASQKYYHDPQLKYFLQRFSDTYLLLYYPIFSIKKAPVDGEIILISPVGIDILYFFSSNVSAESITVEDGRMWTTHWKGKTETMLNPLISLKRTEQIIKGILHKKEIDFPVSKTVLSPDIPIHFQNEPYHTRIIGSKQYPDWFQEKRTLISSLKSRQLKAAEAILMYCQTNAVKRPEWEEEEQPDPLAFHDEE